MPPAFEMAGPRAQICFEPARLTCGIVTCGGLCPGLNNVIRAIVLTLTYAYGVQRVLGFRYGYAGLSATSGFEPLLLTPAVVEDIHEHGGTLLGSSRGPQDVSEMVDTLVQRNVGILFAIGGDGTLRGASALSQEIARRDLSISSLPANSIDAEDCLLLGQHAVHAGMAGRTDMVVGYWNQHFTHVPIALTVAYRKQLDPRGEVWQRVLEATGQPALMASALTANAQGSVTP
jgi:6-phosphofructokinase